MTAIGFRRTLSILLWLLADVRDVDASCDTELCLLRHRAEHAHKPIGRRRIVTSIESVRAVCRLPWSMPRIESEDLREPEQICLASSLRAARKVEALLDSQGVSYVVQVEELGRTTLFGTMRHAAGFYVTAGQASYCRSLLAQAGITQGIVDDAAS